MTRREELIRIIEHFAETDPRYCDCGNLDLHADDLADEIITGLAALPGTDKENPDA